MAASPIEKVSIPDMIADDLRSRILRGDFPEGHQLRQATLASEYEISRMPVREALKRLEAEGLVVFTPHKGAEVTSLAPEDIQEVLHLRKLLEPDILRDAIPKMTDADIEDAKKNAHSFDLALHGDDTNIGELGRYNWALHAALYRPSGRERTMQFLKTLHYQAERYTRLHVILARGKKRASQEHRKLIDYCRKREAKAACTLLSQHIESAEQELLNFLKAQREAK